MSAVVKKPNGKSPDWVVTAQDPHNEKFYFPIGAAWNGTTKEGKEFISVRLKASPLDGKVMLFPPKAGGATDEEVPF